MQYNWTEILKEKTSKELYDIYSGNSFLPDEVIPFARLELENRHFNLTDVESLKDSFKLENIEEELDNLCIELSKRPYFNLKTSLIVISLLITFIVVLLKLQNINFNDLPPIFWIASIAIVVFIMLLDNYIYKKLFQKFKNLEDKKTELLTKFERRGLNDQKLRLIDELSAQSKLRIQEAIRINRFVAAIMFLILTISLILKSLS
ncbi:MAG: hypothetical protein U0T33_12480 [Bacteroidales bacterium]